MLQREGEKSGARVNRLGVPVPAEQSHDYGHHAKNLKMLKEYFRKKNTVMPYPTKECEELPLDKLERESKIKFDADKLPPNVRKEYLKMVDEVIGQKYGDPYLVAKNIFKDFETEEMRDPKIKDFLTTLKVFANEKINVMNDEFNEYMAASTAQNMFEEYIRRE